MMLLMLAAARPGVSFPVIRCSSSSLGKAALHVARHLFDGIAQGGAFDPCQMPVQEVMHGLKFILAKHLQHPADALLHIRVGIAKQALAVGKDQRLIDVGATAHELDACVPAKPLGWYRGHFGCRQDRAASCQVIRIRPPAARRWPLPWKQACARREPVGPPSARAAGDG